LSKSQHNSFRIIAGNWRSRRLQLSPNMQLRPTPERVRETLFNWLGHAVIGARCLDLFAGSGALGLEALSRGAKHVSFVELNKASAYEIQRSLEILKAEADKFIVSIEPAEKFLESAKANQLLFDVIFLDPPFRQDWWKKLSPMLSTLTHSESMIYLEVEKEADQIELPENWSVFREKTAGQVRYYLLKINTE